MSDLFFKPQQNWLKEFNADFVFSSDCCCVIDSQGCFKHLNQSWETLLHYPLAHLLAHAWVSIVAPETLEHTQKAYQLANRDQIVEFQNLLQDAEGHLLPFHWCLWREQNGLIFGIARSPFADELLLCDQTPTTIISIPKSDIPYFSEATERLANVQGGVIEQFEALQENLANESQLAAVRPQILYNISKQTETSFNDQDLLQHILEHLRPAIPFDVSGGLLIQGTSSKLLNYLSNDFLLNQPPCNFFLKTERPVSQQSCDELEQKLVDNLSYLSGQDVRQVELNVHVLDPDLSGASQYGSSQDPIEEIQSRLFVPLVATCESGSTIIGLLFVGSEQENAFTEEHVRLLYFAATHMSMATQRFRSNLALEQLAQVIMNLQDGVALLDHKYQLLLSNGRARDYLAVLAEMGDRPVLERLGAVHVSELLDHSLSEQTAQEVMVPNHPERVFEVIFQSVELEAHACWILVLRDISDRKRFERKIQTALKQARELNQLKSRVMRTVSHEYRSPLTTILVAAELLDKKFERLNETQRHHFLDRISQAGKYMTHLVDDMLLIDKSESGQLKFSPISLDLQKLCLDLIEQFRLQCDAAHSLILEVNGHPRQVQMDPMLIRQILSNLLNNAIKYSPQGGTICLRIDFTPDPVTLHLQDDGLGIPADNLDSIFDSFYRADNIDTIEGSGLGLSIVKKFVELHHGSITVSSVLNAGTSFTLEFPDC